MAGRSALPAMLKAAVVGALISSVLVALSVTMLAAPGRPVVMVGAGVSPGAIVGVAWGTGAALL